MSDSIKDKNLCVVNEILFFLVLTKQCEELLYLYGGGGEQVGNVAAAQSEQGV